MFANLVLLTGNVGGARNVPFGKNVANHLRQQTLRPGTCVSLGSVLPTYVQTGQDQIFDDLAREEIGQPLKQTYTSKR